MPWPRKLSTPRPLAAVLAAVLAAALLAAAGPAHAAERFVQKVVVRPGLVAVVAEGDLEARSIGSYSVRVYSASPGDAAPPDDTTFYTAGLLRPRDGTVSAAVLLPVAGRAQPVVVVTITSAGSGSWRTAEAFSVEPNAVRLLVRVADLGPNDDPVEAVRRQMTMGRL